MWIPLLPGGTIACVIGGWAIAEPVPAGEPVTPLAVLMAAALIVGMKAGDPLVAALLNALV